MKPAGADLGSLVLTLRIWLMLRKILLCAVGLILNDPDVSRRRSESNIPVGGLGQMFQLTLVPAPLKGATP
jgi:hypothetical protein